MDTLTFDVDFGIITESGNHIYYYDGSYEYTPNSETQIILIKDLTAKQNITINPIPKNYGKVSQVGNDLVIE